MTQPEGQYDILRQAVEAFRAATGFRLKIRRTKARLRDGRRADAFIRFHREDIDKQFVVEVKKPLTTATLGTAIRQLEALEPHPGMIVTDYVNPEMAERLRKLDIAFIDTAGNAYLRVRGHPIYIFVKGNKLPRKPIQQTTRGVFYTAGLKVIFAFLCDPDLVTAPYREIAKRAGVALGTVDRTLTDLKELHYLIERGQQHRRLVNRKALLDRWVTNYAERLRPKLVLGTFVATEHDWWQHTKLGHQNGMDAHWGGEIAAARLTRYLKPEVVTIYVRKGATRLQIKHRLRKHPDGEVELLKTFWDPDFDKDPNLAPALVVYADLLAIGDPRDIEAAKLIYERELAGLVGKN